MTSLVRTLLLMFLLFPGLVMAQETVFENTTDNTLLLQVNNTSSVFELPGVTVEVTESPDWLSFATTTATLGDIAASGDNVASFMFDVDDGTAGNTGTIKMKIEASSGDVFTGAEEPNLDVTVTVFAGGAIAYIMDRSGSMSGTPIANAKIAANQGITLMNEGDEVAVVSFSSSASTDLGLRTINDDSDREAARAAINGLSAGGLTSIGAGLLQGCSVLGGSSASSRNYVLLSDGFHNTPPDPSEGLACIQGLSGPDSEPLASSVAVSSIVEPLAAVQTDRIHSIAFGLGADQVLLASLSAATGGVFLFVPETNDPLALADLFLTIQGEINEEQRLGTFEGTLTSPDEAEHVFSIGSDISEETVTLIWDDLAANLDLSLEAPDGTVIDASNWDSISGVDRVEGPGIEYFTLSSPDVGDWKAFVTAVSGTASYAVVLSGQSSIQMDAFFDKDEYAPNAPILISASILEGGSTPVIDATVTAQVTTPTAAGVQLMAQQQASLEETMALVTKSEDANGFVNEEGTVLFVSETLTLFDDGTHGDGAANDGVYANSFTDTQNEGTYSFQVSADGTSPAGIDFTREASLATVVTATAISQFSLSVSSTKPDNDVDITVSPGDVNGSGDGSTPFDRLYNENTVVTLSAPDVAANGFVFEYWIIDDSINVSTSAVDVTMDSDHSAVATYLPPLPHAYVLLADKVVNMNGAAQSQGLIHANQRINFTEGLPSTHTGDLTAVNAIRVATNNTVEGDASAGATVRFEDGATLTGTATEGADIQVELLPPLSFTSGGEAISVATNATVDLAPGSYGMVRIGQGGTLNLVEGDYYFNGLNVDPDGKVITTVDEQVTSVNVVQDIRFGANAVVNVMPLGDAGSRFLTMNSRQGDISIARNGSVIGSLIAPDGLVRVARDAVYRGAICAENISIESGATVQHHNTPLATSAQVSMAANTSFSKESIAVQVELPDQIALLPNYPNPFNPTTTIQFHLPETVQVRLSVYDMLGREIVVLVHGTISAGEHSVVFDASRFSNGTYLYKMVTPEQTLTGRMMLLK